MTADTALARRLWTLFEPVHGVPYFAPEARAAYEEAGLRGYWRGYFAGRAAPLGGVDAAPVIAAFFSFAPAMVQRALPDVWSRAAPEQALAARFAGASATLGRLLDGHAGALAESVELLERVTGPIDCGGRVLAAANAALPRRTEPLERLWQATSVLREHRGDGHVAALVSAGVDGCEALAWRAGLDVPREILQPNRGWTDEQWESAQARLVERGWLDQTGTCTPQGRARHAEVEETTDLAAAAPWRVLTATETARLVDLLTPLARACVAEMPYPNPIGLRPGNGVAAHG